MGEYLQQLGRTDVDVLDYGSGWGGETLWLARHVRSVVGVDVDYQSVRRSDEALQQSGLANCAFAHSDNGNLPFRDSSFDAVFSTDTFEHVMDLDLAFRELRRVLRPGGRLISRFGPLFYSPHGYHLYWACKVPWAHLLFGLGPILELRELRSGTVLKAETWEDMGLNQRTFGDIKRSALSANFEMVKLDAVPVRGLRLLTRLPVVGDLFIFGVDMHLRRPQ